MGLVLALVLLHLARQEALVLALAAIDRPTTSPRRSGQLAAFFGFGEVHPIFNTPPPYTIEVLYIP